MRGDVMWDDEDRGTVAEQWPRMLKTTAPVWQEAANTWPWLEVHCGNCGVHWTVNPKKEEGHGITCPKCNFHDPFFDWTIQPWELPPWER